jgi:myo-inositol-1(or 4)-monophosphatase
MPASELQDWLAAAEEAARIGGEILLDWQSRFTVREKGRNDLVTEADVAAQEAIHAYFARHFPDHAFLGEENRDGSALRRVNSQQPTWIVDPLDGTTNYAHKIPVFAVSIGLEVAGELVVGVVFDPTRQELFRAARGQGAWLGEQRLHTSSTTRLAEAVLSTGFPPDLAGQEHTLEVWRYFSLHAQSLRRTGCTSLNMAYVAAGRNDGFWTHQAWPWDAAAGTVLIREAGGVVTNLDGTPYDLYTLDIVGSNGSLHQAMVAGVREALNH